MASLEVSTKDLWKKHVEFSDNKLSRSNLQLPHKNISEVDRKTSIYSSQRSKSSMSFDEARLSSLQDIYHLSSKINQLRCYDIDKRNPTYDTTNTDSVCITTSAVSSDLAKKYFPITLGESYKVNAQFASTGAPPALPTFSPPATGIPLPSEEPWRPKTQENKTELRYKWTPTSQLVNDKKEFLTNTPNSVLFDPIADIASAYTNTPYMAELARLRLERLRLEEDILNEAIRQEELEKMRGPQPKWYELKTPQFHYESHKNLGILRKTEQYQDLYERRLELTRESAEAQNRLASQLSKTYDKQRYLNQQME